MPRPRISAISFLNTAPLMWDLVHGSAGKDFEISYTVPSLCAESLRTGTADIGIVPVVACTFIPGLKIIPDVAIASKRSVRSILLVCRKPIEEVKTVAADTSSRTSVALARVLFRKWWGGARQFHAMAPDLGDMLRECDAALIIGDPALTVDRNKFVCYDLAEEWNRLTGKPFVFAFWAVRAEAAEHSPVDLVQIFQQSRDHGLQNVDALAREWAPRVGISEDAVRSYLTENIDFSLDAGNLAGMELFFHYAVECGAIAAAPPLEFVGAKAASR
ncbi:MAG: menaquinone biosynthesis protein [Acidobacteriia bacterium]|nr:menaquinone biosynthesis protein [Terriglobia bacterium]